ncbi:DUF2971 domain-containing protein [Pseudomonas putida]|uniref:DUF2971 domain-containing protein n=1 Tax=Pseudomonas putida TaxID=303 RepID=UPI00211988A7|nr:DUF2971 domain-containing protein [Pseudomonas putida]
MSVEKYLSLLSSSKIFLCRLDKFEDTWEGVWPKAFFTALMSGLKKKGVDPDYLSTVHRKWLFVNCWHANEYESAAMWDLYGSRSSGVAIKTTIGELKKNISSEKGFMIGAVDYLDVERDQRMLEFNMVVPAFLKRFSFKHEHEVRVVVFDAGQIIEENGDNRIGAPRDFLELDINLQGLLAEVLFSPSMPKWLVDSLISVSEKYGITRQRFTQSRLYENYVI